MGCYHEGKFWSDETIWKVTKNVMPEPFRTSDLIRQCLSWNMGDLQDFAREMKKVQEANLDYPIVVSPFGDIVDGCHRVVKAYLENKPIVFAKIFDMTTVPPDYDEYEAVHGKR